MHDETLDSPNGGNGAQQGGESVGVLKQRVAELEAALVRMTRQREETRRMLFELRDQMLPDDPPPTEEELTEEWKTRTEKSISEMLAELEQQAGAGSP